MKVLFVFRESSEIQNYLIRAQADSLIDNGIDIEFFNITSGGIMGYLKSILRLRKHLKINYYDFIHAHYSYSGIMASLVCTRPVITSLMGSDIRKSYFTLLILSFFYNFFWFGTIVKSKKMNDKLKYTKSFIIPNGVDLKIFKEIDKNEALNKVKFKKKYNLLFVAFGENSRVKNYDLAKQAFDSIRSSDKELHVISKIKHNELPYYYNAADALVLTSFSEGSPNVIKEAMACNCPIVSTDVGDVREVLGNTYGCYMSSFSPNDVAEKINMALDFSKTIGRTNGRKRIMELGLDADTIAKKIIDVYKETLHS